MTKAIRNTKIEIKLSSTIIFLLIISLRPRPLKKISIIETIKKDKHYKNRQRGHPATGVNAIKIVKIDKNKAKNFSYIKCYTYK